MKKLVSLIIILIAGQTFGQISKASKLIIDDKTDFKIDKLNQTYESRYVRVTELNNGIIETTTITDTVTADLRVNYNPKEKDNEQIYINSTKGKLNGDTLRINLFHHGSGFIWEYDIIIVKGQYQISTWFTPPINSRRVKIRPLTTLLKINTTDFVKGKEIKGYTKFKGKCNGDDRDCFSKDILIEGDFKVMIE